MESWRRVTNESSGEVLTFIETAEETRGASVVALIEVQPGGGPLLHSHSQAETFELVSGTIEIRHKDTPRLLQPGEAAFVPSGELHTFTNPGAEISTVKVTVVPPEHFERSMRILAGLARDGRLGPEGKRPREPALMAALARPTDFYMPPMPRPVWRAMNALLAPFGRRAYEEAVRTYDRPRPSPGERVA